MSTRESSPTLSSLTNTTISESDHSSQCLSCYDSTLFSLLLCLYLRACMSELIKLAALYLVLPLLVLFASFKCLPCKLVTWVQKISKRNLGITESVTLT